MSDTQHTILVVDDNPNNRDLIRRRLERDGYRVLTADDGSAGLDIIDHQPLDLVILDVMMPGLSGTDVLRVVRERFSQSELPVIMATAKDQSEDIVLALDLGANDYVTKPLDFPVVLARVHSHIRAAEAARSNAKVEEPPIPFDSLRPGLVLAEKYRLEERIGTGNFGVVYRATHLAFEQPVALKFLKTSVDDLEPGDLERFRQEGSSAFRLQHPNAVHVMDFAIAHGLTFLVMELLDGETLDDRIKRLGSLPIPDALEIILPICDVLAEAHALGIIHRDVKPANIALHRSPRGEVIKVLDFGIAKLVGDANAGKHLTLDEGILGTPAYMAPERLSGREYDGRSDVYSVGIMLYQMIAGALPFRAKTNEALAIALLHLTDAPERLHNHLPDVPIQLDALIMSTIRKDPFERPETEELARRLREIAAELTLQHSPIVESVLPTDGQEEPTLILSGTNLGRLGFDFSDLLTPPDSSLLDDSPLPAQPPVDRLDEPWT
ncbi:MAG: protein kinase [Acidobacteriota bacterium]